MHIRGLDETGHISAKPSRFWQLVATAVWLCGMLAVSPLAAQQTEPQTDDPPPAAATAPVEGLEEQPPGESTVATDEDAELAASSDPMGEEINFFRLLVQGGAFMIPILIMSLVAMTAAIERAFGLRRGRVLPPKLVSALGQLGSAPGGFDPKRAYALCQQYPSAASNVIRAMLLKVGRPHSEVEHTVQETAQREAERLFANVRWLNLAAAVTPLLGLLGTVWGMIIAFHDTTVLAPGQNKAEFLARGIYIALVTTLGGLMVAIPAAVLSHFFEGRVQTLFHQIDELVFNLLPQVERFEGRVRFNRQGDAGTGKSDVESTIEPPPVTGRTAATK